MIRTVNLLFVADSYVTGPGLISEAWFALNFNVAGRDKNISG